MEKNYKIMFTGERQVELVEIPYPQPEPGNVLIKTLVSQISTGTELTMLEGKAVVDADSTWAAGISYPVSAGYSNVGEIIAVGEGADESLIGKKVLTDAFHQNYAVKNPNGNGTFAILPDGVEPSDAVFGIIAQITLGSIRGAKIRPGETVVVFGAGLIGQLVARFAKIAGAINVIVADVSDYRLSMVPNEPVFKTLNTKDMPLEDITAFIEANNDGRLADIVFETTSYQGLLDTELRCIAKNGKLVVTSNPKGKSVFDFDYCNRKGITVIGAHNMRMHTSAATELDRWTCRADSEYFLKLLQKELVTVNNMITHETSYKNAADMYNLLMEDRTKALAVHLTWED